MGMLLASFWKELELPSDPFSPSQFLWLLWFGFLAGIILASEPIGSSIQMEWDTKTTVSSLPAANTALAAGAVVCALVAAMLIR